MSETATLTPANWRDPALLRASFASVPSFLPTAPIRCRPGPHSPLVAAPTDVGDVSVSPRHGSVRDVLAATDTDAWLVLHAGRVVAEQYVAPMTPTTPHLLMSVSKSIVSVVCGALVDRGVLDPAQQVTAYVPELVRSGYAGTTLRDVLDMRTGVRFSEDYLDPDAEVCLLDEAAGWAPARAGGPATIKHLLGSLVTDRPHGSHFDYRSCETDVLGWVVEAATGQAFSDVAGDTLWGPLGAETGAAITVDAEGTGMFDGGICATLRDLGRFGAMLLAGGVSATGERIVGEGWLDDVFAGSPDLVDAFAAGPQAGLLPGGHYRSQFWVPPGGDVVMCVGIHGQLVYVDRSARMVAVKLSSWPVPTDAERMNKTLAMVAALRHHLPSRAW